MDVEAEIVELKRRVAALEGEAQDEKQLSRRLFQYVRESRDDIALLRSHAVVTEQRLEAVEQKLDRLEQGMDRLEQRLAKVESDLSQLRSEFEGFRRELPGLIADTMREVLRDYRAR